MAREDGLGRLVTAVSGEQVVSKVSGELVVSKISGEQVISKISGEQVVSRISGQTVIAEISGQLAWVSGQTVYVGYVTPHMGGMDVYVSGQAVKVSGEVVDIETPNYVRSRHFLFPSAASGGTALESGVVRSVTLKSLSGDVLVGGTGNESPCSGFGFLLAAGEALTYDIDNFNRIRVMARTTSGDGVTYTGNDIT